MKKINQRIKKKPLLIFTIVFYVLFFLSSICITYLILKVANVENLVRYILVSLLILLLIFNGIQLYKIIFKGKNLLIIIFGIILAILFVGESYTCGIINGFYSSISNIYKDTNVYSSSLVVMTNSNIKNIKDIKSLKIGMLKDTNSIDGYQIPLDIINEYNLNKNNEIVEFDSLGEIISNLYEGNINAALITSTYVSMLDNNEGYENIKTDTKIIYNKNKTIKKDDIAIEKDITEPISVLVMGIDSTVKDISKVTAFNADSLMLVTFNPKTYNATILSIPRDTYTNITCLSNSPKSKITHSGWHGESCVVKTVGSLMDIDIDYYVKINFTGVVNLVDAINGVEIDVPYSFCEQNSNRDWGKDTVYVKKGLQVLNGEQALALSRNRHPNPECGSEWANYNSNDFIRGQNQQLVMNAMLNKIIKSADLNKVRSLLNIVDKNVDTNINTNKMLSYYSIIKELAVNSDDNVISFERLYLSTYGKTIYDVLMKMPLSDQVYYDESLKEIIKEMKINLGLESPTIIKTFSFSINNEYTSPIIGKGNYTASPLDSMPNFKGKDKAIVEQWALEKNIKVNIIYKDVNEGIQDSVLTQSIPSQYILDGSIKELNITLANVITNENVNTNENTNTETNVTQ